MLLSKANRNFTGRQGESDVRVPVRLAPEPEIRRDLFMSTRSFAIFSLALLTLLAVIGIPWTCAWASEAFSPVSAEELKITSEPMAPGAPAIILYRRVDRDDDGYPSHEDVYLRIKILSEEGRSYANVEIPFSKDNQKVVNIRARTIKPDGTIVNFDKAIYEHFVVKGRDVKYLVKAFSLSDVQVGGIIEYSYTIDLSDQYIYDSHWILSQPLFTKKASFSLKPYKGRRIPITLRWSWQGLPPGSDPKEGRDHIVRMDAVNIPAFETEDFMPPANELMSRVDFIYDQHVNDSDPDKYWKKIGKQRYEELEDFIGKRSAMAEAVGKIVSPNDPPEIKLRKIYDRVQQIRNTSYEVQKTAQEEKRDKETTAENVEDVWKRGYGNGVQLTWLYLALVRAAGMEAYGVWVSNRHYYFFTPRTMESRKLDANVVLVKLNGKDLYFDPGAMFTPFGLLTWYETATPGLRLDKDGGSWIHTPLPPSSESHIERTTNLKLSDSGDLEGELTLTYTGLEAMYRRVQELNADDLARKKTLEDNVKAQVPGTIDVTLSNHPDWKSSSAPLVAEFHVKISGWVSSAGRRATLPVGIFAAHEKHIFEHANRVHPIYFEYPFEKLDDISIELPPGWQVDSIPSARTEDEHLVLYSLKVEKANRTLHVVRRVSVDFVILQPKYYPALRSFFQIVRNGDDEQILLQPAAATAAN